MEYGVDLAVHTISGQRRVRAQRLENDKPNCRRDRFLQFVLVQRRTGFRVALGDDGFEVFEGSKKQPSGRVVWTEVREIRTYKRDLWSYDQICLAFRVGEEEWVEIGEGDAHFLATCERIRQVFPDIPEHWYNDVMLPAFAPNDTLLYRRADEPA